jgi:hypothetical protein
MVIMWDWFVLPLGASSISMSHACGLSLLLLLAFGAAHRTVGEGHCHSVYRMCVFSVLVPLFILIFGAVAHSLMISP